MRGDKFFSACQLVDGLHQIGSVRFKEIDFASTGFPANSANLCATAVRPGRNECAELRFYLIPNYPLCAGFAGCALMPD